MARKPTATARKPMVTTLDGNEAVRKTVLARLLKAADNPKIPVAVLHALTQSLEEWPREAG